MDQVLGERGGEIAADRARGRLSGVGGTHHRAHDLPGVLGTLDDEHQRRRAGDELDELPVEALALVLGVVLGRGVAIDRPQLGGNQLQALGLEAGEDLTGEAALHGVGLGDDECPVHEAGEVTGRGNRSRDTSALRPSLPGVRLKDEITIAAPAETVWALTLDIERWPETTSTMTEITRLDHGPLAVGSRARVKQPAQRPRVWTVTRLEPNRYEWEARLGSIRMRGGHHVTPTDGGCTNRLTLDLEGFGSSLFGRLVGRSLTKALRTENEGFKTAAESR